MDDRLGYEGASSGDPGQAGVVSHRESHREVSGVTVSVTLELVEALGAVAKVPGVGCYETIRIKAGCPTLSTVVELGAWTKKLATGGMSGVDPATITVNVVEFPMYGPLPAKRESKTFPVLVPFGASTRTPTEVSFPEDRNTFIGWRE